MGKAIGCSHTHASMLLQLYEGDEYVTATKRHKRGERKANEYRYLGPLE